MNKFIKNIPKAELHCHLDGSIRESTFFELLDQENISYDKDILKENYKSLSEYLSVFQYTTKILQKKENIYRIGKELVEDLLSDNVYYLELRFDPFLFVNENLSFNDALIALNEGIIAGTQNTDKPFDFGLILCALRHVEPTYSKFYEDLFRGNKQDSALSLLVYFTALLKKKCPDIPIIGLDLAGDESIGGCDKFADNFKKAKEIGLNITIHAGEARGSESILSALKDCSAQRIGHGLHLFDNTPESLETQSILIEESIPLEVCLTSNDQTSDIPLSNHPIKQFLEKNIPVILCTDNMLVSKTNLSKEYQKASTIGITDQQLLEIAKNSFKYRFKQDHEFTKKIDNLFESHKNLKN
jgi:adenosine deaminase